MTRDDPRDPLIALRIPPALDARLRAHAADTGSTLSEIVRDAIATALDPEPVHIVSQTKVRVSRSGKVERQAMCQHRVRQGNYCRRCDGVV